MEIACNSCSKSSPWPEDSFGKRIRCPHCFSVYYAPAAGPAWQALDSALLLEEATGEEEDAEEPYDEEELYDEPAGPSLLSSQRTVFILLRQSLVDFHDYRHDLPRMVLILPPVLVLICLAAFVAQVLLGLLGAGLHYLTGVSLNLLLYITPLIPLLMVLDLKQGMTKKAIRLQKDGEWLVRFELGRLWATCEIYEIGGALLFLAVLIGLQAGLLYGTTDHLGLPTAATLPGCWLLTIDNLCHGVFFDVFEMYDIHLGGKVEHSTFSATTFYAFRLSFDALVAVTIYRLWMRFRIRELVGSIPREDVTSAELAEWIARRCGDEERWPRLFFDEFIFLLLVSEYLRSNFEMVVHLSRRFSRLEVADEVRDLFTDPAGNPLFHRTTD
jgi:hypothetical protein